tara:strand:+ start:355 stop:1464 length:1110 start_codon:yes stop_codon:yes gene_type:complete
MIKFYNNFIKKQIITLWKILQHFFVLINFSKIIKSKKIKIFYAGAISGNYGGSFVKIKRIKEFYPKSYLSFNLVYILSNAIFVIPQSISYLKKNKIPIILNQNGVFYSGWYNGNWKKKNFEMSNIYHQADFVFWQSKFCKKCADKFLGKRKGPGEVLYNSVDTDIFIPKNKKLTRNQNTFNFLITGKIPYALEYRVISAIRGLDLAIKKGLDANLIVAGELDKKVLVNCKQLINQLNIRNRFLYLGRYSQANAPIIYQKGDAYIMLKYKDPCPNTVIEAMSCGLPVLYSNSGGLPEIVSQDCGIGLRVRDSWEKGDIIPKYSDIADGMLKIYDNHKKFSQNARNLAVRKFDLKFWIERHKLIFKKYKST